MISFAAVDFLVCFLRFTSREKYLFDLGDTFHWLSEQFCNSYIATDVIFCLLVSSPLALVDVKADFSLMESTTHMSPLVKKRMVRIWSSYFQKENYSRYCTITGILEANNISSIICLFLCKIFDQGTYSSGSCRSRYILRQITEARTGNSWRSSADNYYRERMRVGLTIPIRAVQTTLLFVVSFFLLLGQGTKTFSLHTRAEQRCPVWQ